MQLITGVQNMLQQNVDEDVYNEFGEETNFKGEPISKFSSLT